MAYNEIVRLARLVAVTFSGLLVSGFSFAADRSRADIEKLIDKLVETSWKHSYSPYGKFDVDEIPKMSQSDLAERALLLLGPKALPALLDHVTDARKTKTTISTEYSSVYFGRYRPRYEWNPLSPIDNDHPRYERNAPSSYTLCVGDICYSLIGNIVNRPLIPVSKNKLLMIMSPVENPALAKAVRSDWSDLSEEAYQEHLKNDICNGQDRWSGKALELLVTFYPKEAETFSIKLLNRPIDEQSNIGEFVDGRLLKSNNPNEWKLMLHDFSVRNSVLETSMIPYYLSPNDPREPLAEKITRYIFPEFNPILSGVPPTTTLDELKVIINGTIGLRSKEIDETVQNSFRRAKSIDILKMNVDDAESCQIYMDIVSLAAINRMANKGFNDEYIAYFLKRIEILNKSAVRYDDQSDLREFKTWVAKLKPGP